MEKIELEAQKREAARTGLKKIRQEGLVPGVVYGRKLKALAVTVNKKSFIKQVLRSEAGMNAIITLKISGEKAKEIPVLTQAVQRNPLTDDILHIDFRHLIMDEAIKTKVPIELIGLPIGVKETGGVLVHGLREVEVECLPTNIPDKFEIDVSALKIGDSLHVSDLPAVTKVKVLTNASEMVANCSPPTKEEEVAAPIPTPEEVAGAEAAVAVAEEKVKEKTAPGAAPAEKKPEAAAPKVEKK